MVENKNNAAFGVQGMQRNSLGHLLDEKAYTFQLNGNLETDETGGISLTNEHSNLLCSKFKPGYKVIGNKIDVNSSKVYFFLTNPETGISEIGYIPYLHSVEDETDEIQEGCNCTYKSVLSEPLEGQVQIEGCEYITMLSDECNLCLNFDVQHPIKKIELKGEKFFRTLYWTDAKNPPRYLQLNELEQYKINGEEICGEIICGEDVEVENPQVIEDCETCLNCEKLKIHRGYQIPYIEPSVIRFGGNLKRGSYEFLVAYSDRLGNELSEYFSITNPINIFDTNSYVLSQPQYADRTNMSISLNVDNLDSRYKYYKVAVIQTADINENVSVYVEGIHPTTDTNIIYSTEIDKQSISLQQLFLQKPIFKTWRGLTSANGYLFGYGYTTEKEWNLQPVVSLMGGFLKWQTHQSMEGLYEDGVNNSKFKSYIRDENYMFSIRFGTKDGYWTAKFPLISRPSNSFEEEEVVSEVNGDYTGNTLNEASILESAPECAKTGRTKRWQYYNTAEVEGSCAIVGEESDFETIVKQTEEVCKVQLTDTDTGLKTDVIDTIEQGSITIDISNNNSRFTGLKDWFKANRDLIRWCCNGGVSNCQQEAPEQSCPSVNYDLTLCNLATNTYPDINCTPQMPFDICDTCTDSSELAAKECLTPTFIECSEDIYIKSVEGENYQLDPKTFPTEYQRTEYFGECEIYIEGTGEGFFLGRLPEKTFVIELPLNMYFTTVIPKRLDSTLRNKSCSKAATLFYERDIFESYFMPYGYNTEAREELLTDIPTDYTDAQFTDSFLTKNAIWFKVEKSELTSQNEGEERTLIFETTKQGTDYPYDYTATNTIDLIYLAQTTDIRYTIYTGCDYSTILESGVIDINSGFWKMFSESDFVGTEDLYIAFDSPIKDYADGEIYEDGPVWLIAPNLNCFNVLKRDKEYTSVTIDFEAIEISKKETYLTECKYIVPNLDACGASPYQYGKFGYWESEETYPDNKDLYDSSTLKIKPSSIPFYLKSDFEEYYTDGIAGESYLLKDDTDFTCKPIRGYKTPDNAVSPLMFNQPTSDSVDTIIYPLGITLDDQVINSFLDVAVDNGLITKEQRESVTNYELYRGDRTIHRSVLFKGIGSDMYKNLEGSEDRWFRNFPYNSLGENQLIYTNKNRNRLIKHPFSGSTRNNKFSLMAPEVYVNQPTGATEVVVEGYQMGYSTGAFREVENHSKWVILGDDAKDLSSTLATLEVVFETAMIIGDATIQAAQTMWVVGGLGSTGGGMIGIGVSTVALGVLIGASIATAVTFKYARYKYQWLDIFKNNGTPYNFANYFASSGKMNYFLPNKIEGSYLRGLTVGKYIKPGTAIITDQKGKETLKINNIDRETSYFMSFGERSYAIEYPESYLYWDNVDNSPSQSSRYLSSDENCSKDFAERRIGSPYMSVKIYNPTQYGTIDSVKWLPINHNGKIQRDNIEENQCKPIFGGDVFITRSAFKNKFPLFSSTAMNLPDRVPFDYFQYSNIGSTRFYASYDTPINRITNGTRLPIQDTTFVFNCPDEETTFSNDFYVKPSQREAYKFYLYYYGVPSFFVESEINNEYRIAGKEPHEQFFPNVDIIEWTQEDKNSITNNNTFFYNNVYSKSTTNNGSRTLPSYYNKKEWDSLFEYPNGVVWSQQDNSEQDLRDPWLIFKPNDKYQFDADYGQLIDLTAIESKQVLGRFENNALVFNAVDTLADRLTETTANLGTGGIFATRPVEFSHTELGETGTQSTQITTTEFGHFWADAKRGKVFQLQPNAKGLTDRTSFKRDGSPTQMRQWFKRQLPFKILKHFPEIDVDNPWNGAGITMGWDSKFKRVFITKKDYIPNSTENLCVDENGILRDSTNTQDIIDEYTAQEYVYEGEEGCKLKFTKTNKIIKAGSTLFAVQDTTGSFSVQDRADISTALNEFVQDYNSTLTEEEKITLVEVNSTAISGSGAENWLKHTKEIENYFGVGNLSDKDVVFISFCNEAQPVYHGGGLTLPNNIAKNNFVQDYNYFLSLYSQLNSFKGIAYPIILNNTFYNGGVGILQQTLMAYYGQNISQQKADSIEVNSSLSSADWITLKDNLINNNVYTTPPYQISGLKNYGWFVQTDLNNFDGETITPERFQTDVENLLSNGQTIEEGETLYVDLPVATYDGFKDVSWTIAYSPIYDSWVSYYSFKPNYYINQNDFFQTGINNPKDEAELGLWSHLLTNKSFQVFYGKKYPWEIEVPFKNEYYSKVLKSIRLNVSTYRYHNDYDLAEKRKNSFNRALLYNLTNNSGYLDLEYSDYADDYKYPKQVDRLTQKIKATHHKGNISFSYFFNRVIDQDNNIPIKKWDENGINFKLNPQAVSFRSKQTLERMRGEMFYLRLTQDKSSQYKQLFKWGFSKEQQDI